MRAKFHCVQVTKTAWGSEIAELTAVTGKQGELSENASFNKATPNAQLKMQIDNPAAQGFLKPGGEYYLDFTEAPKGG